MHTSCYHAKKGNFFKFILSMHQIHFFHQSCHMSQSCHMTYFDIDAFFCCTYIATSSSHTATASTLHGLGWTANAEGVLNISSSVVEIHILKEIDNWCDNIVLHNLQAIHYFAFAMVSEQWVPVDSINTYGKFSKENIFQFQSMQKLDIW